MYQNPENVTKITSKYFNYGHCFSTRYVDFVIHRYKYVASLERKINKSMKVKYFVVLDFQFHLCR